MRGGRCAACDCVLCASHPDRVEPCDLMQVGLCARWSPAATAWGMHDWLLALWGGAGGAGAGANRSVPRGRYTVHTATPGPCVTPAQECNTRTGDDLMRAGGGTGGNRLATDAHTGEASHWAPTGGNYTPTSATVTVRHIEHTRDTGGHYAHAGPSLKPGATTPTSASPSGLSM